MLRSKNMAHSWWCMYIWIGRLIIVCVLVNVSAIVLLQVHKGIHLVLVGHCQMSSCRGGSEWQVSTWSQSDRTKNMTYSWCMYIWIGYLIIVCVLGNASVTVRCKHTNVYIWYWRMYIWIGCVCVLGNVSVIVCRKHMNVYIWYWLGNAKRAHVRV